MPELMIEDTLLKTSSSESTELMPLEMVTTPSINELPPEMLIPVLCLLDENSLRQARLVCRKWTDCALQILSKFPGQVVFCCGQGNELRGKGLERIEKLQSILPFTNYPQMFFSKLILHCGVLDQDIERIVNLLKNYGSNLKSLALQSTQIPLNSSILRPMLEHWCANLEELSLRGICVTEDKTTTIQDLQTSLTPLRLKLRKLKIYDATQPPTALNFFVSILKISPNVQILHMDTLNGQPDFWRNVQNFPNITKNLEEVKIEMFGIADITVMSDVSFSNKLTSLTLKIRNPTFPKEKLAGFLQKVGDSLEKLTLQLYINTNLTDINLSYWKIELPLMKKLKTLQHSFHCELLFDSIDFLKKLPNLEILRLSCSYMIPCTIRPEFVDALFSNAWYLPMHPHTTLNTLAIKGTPKNPVAIFTINRMFPNLRDLTLAVDTKEIPQSIKESSLTRVFTGFSEMKNLKILHLVFYDSPTWDPSVNFETCFSPLKASESLEELKLTRSYLNSPYKTPFPLGLGEVFVRVPKLKILRLQNFVLDISDEMKLFKTLEQKRILLKAEKTWNFEGFCAME